MADPADVAALTALLGRPPQADFDVVVRDRTGGPVVVRNAPRTSDGTPMPTRFWLVGADVVQAVSRLESAGGVRDAEAAVDADALVRAHEVYAAERERALGAVDGDAPRPSGGVAGTRIGVKCLHAHLANLLAGADDPVGRWTVERLPADVVAGLSVPPPTSTSNEHEEPT